MNIREQILDGLKNRFPGVEISILGRIADKLAKTTTTAEDVATAVEGVTTQMLLQSYGDSRANEAARTAIANYESNHGIKDGKPVTATGSNPQTPQKKNASETDPIPSKNEEAPAWAKGLLDTVNSLANQVKAMQGEKITDSRRAQINQLINGRFSESRLKSLNRIPLDSMSDEDFETFKAEITTELEEMSQASQTKGVVFGKPTIGGGSSTQPTPNPGTKATTQEIEDIMSHMRL